MLPEPLGKQAPISLWRTIFERAGVPPWPSVTRMEVVCGAETLEEKQYTII